MPVCLYRHQILTEYKTAAPFRERLSYCYVDRLLREHILALVEQGQQEEVSDQVEDFGSEKLFHAFCSIRKVHSFPPWKNKYLLRKRPALQKAER